MRAVILSCLIDVVPDKIRAMGLLEDLGDLLLDRLASLQVVTVEFRLEYPEPLQGLLNPLSIPAKE